MNGLDAGLKKKALMGVVFVVLDEVMKARMEGKEA